MQPHLRYRDHARKLLILGLPLIGSHLAQFAIGMSDTLMLGWYAVDALAAQVIGATIFFVLFIMGSAFSFAVMPMVAAAHTSGDEVQIRRITRMGIWISFFYGLMTLPLMIWSEGVLLALGQTPETAALGAQYLQIMGLGILPALGVMVLKSYLSALELTKVVLWVTLLALVLNIVINYLLIFGNAGFPELGVRGAAIASLIVNTASLAILVGYVARACPEHALFRHLWRPDWEAFGQVFRLGWPIGLTNLAEVGLFAASSIMMGWLGTLELAAHGAALQVTSAVFMIHIGLSNAATVRAAQAFDRKDGPGLRAGALVVFAVSLSVALLTVVVFLTLPEFLIGLFMSPTEANRPAVIAIGVTLLAAAALFQVVDASQIMAVSLLRGVQDTKIPMVIAALSYWAVGVPCSYLLGFTLGWGGVGIWLGLAAGLALAGVFLITRFWVFSGRGLRARA